MSSLSSLNERLKLLLTMAAAVSLAMTAVGWAFLTWTEWRDVPDRQLKADERMARIEQNLAALGADRPQIVSFLGAGIVSEPVARPGGHLNVTYVLRRNIDCPTRVLVRFYDLSANVIASRYSYSIDAVRSPVSSSYSPLAIRVSIPGNMAPGHYAYFPELHPQDCGAYGPMVPPMSHPFQVVPS